MIIIAGSNHSSLAYSIANKISAPFIQANVYNQDVVIVQSTSKPANDNLLELLLLADAAKRAGANKITAIIPYFGYSRQDRISSDHEPISASLMAKLIEASGIEHVITLDLHSKQIEDFFNISIDNINVQNLFLPLFQDGKEYIVVSPDIGGMMRAQKFSQALGSGFAVINKIRDKNGDCNMSGALETIANKHCILVDDIIDTGKTICKAADLLMEKGALSVKACVTHGVFSGNAIELVANSNINEIFITDSIIHKNLPSKFKIISVSDILANCLLNNS